ncbi:MAG: GGDEF domain-containing protein [Thermodesulfobacteriota bacterium]
MNFERHIINRRVIDDLKNRSTIGMYFYVLVTIAVLSVEGFYRRHATFSICFLGVMVVIAVFRIAHFYLFDKLDQKNPRLNYCGFFTSVYATALTWGLGFAYFMIQPEELSSKMIMLASTVGLDSGGVVAFIPSRRTSVIYNFLTLLPGALLMLFYQVNLILVFLIILFAAYMTLVAFRGNREYWDALENEHLLQLKTEEIEKISRIDILTGLYNRRYFDEIFHLQWKTAARSGIQLSIIICDIDYFKWVNDTYGHLAGDAFLKKTAAVLTGIFQRDTDFIARYGGEEFVILLMNQDPQGAVELAEKVRSEIEQMSLFHEDQQIRTTISLGIAACVPQLDGNRDKLLGKADDALYQAKNNGRNQVVYYGK